jgi:hypothetical protein
VKVGKRSLPLLNLCAIEKSEVERWSDKSQEMKRKGKVSPRMAKSTQSKSNNHDGTYYPFSFSLHVPSKNLIIARYSRARRRHQFFFRFLSFLLSSPKLYSTTVRVASDNYTFSLHFEEEASEGYTRPRLVHVVL